MCWHYMYRDCFKYLYKTKKNPLYSYENIELSSNMIMYEKIHFTPYQQNLIKGYTG